MPTPLIVRSVVSRISRTTIFSVAVALAAVSSLASAQTLTHLYYFESKQYPYYPNGVILDRAGNLYGTTLQGNLTGGDCCGIVYKLNPKTKVLQVLYQFGGANDGSEPGGITFGPDGALYGSTEAGGNDACFSGCGTIFKLQPQPSFCASASCPWDETTLYEFNGPDGDNPTGVTFDKVGNIFGVTGRGGVLQGCGAPGCGLVYQLVNSGGNWGQNILYEFLGGNDGGVPGAALAIDGSGNLYGTTTGYGAYQCGTAFGMTSSAGQGWTFDTLYAFNPDNGDGCGPSSEMFLGAEGNLYGTTVGYSGSFGSAFELTPTRNGWTEATLYAFPKGVQGPLSPLILNDRGSLYGTAYATGPDSCGSIFELTPEPDGWLYIVLYNFSLEQDGCGPIGPIAMDSQGNIYGTNQAGLVWELTP